MACIPFQAERVSVKAPPFVAMDSLVRNTIWEKLRAERL